MGESLEAEIAALSQQIEEKRAQLESEANFVPEGKDLVKETLREHIGAAGAAASLVAKSDDTDDTSASYLDNLDEESVDTLNSLIESVHDKGIMNTIDQAKKGDPYILDAFHDALTDKLYDELKERKLI